MEGKQEELKVEKLRSSDNDTESTVQLHQDAKKVENVLKFLDSLNTYLILMDSLSSKLRQGWLELASARHSMGSSRISSALFDLKYHHAATSVEVDHHDAGSIVKQPHFTLHKWASPDNQEFSSEEAKFEEDELLHRKSSSPHQNQEKRPENNGSEGVGSPHTVDNHVQKERAKSMSMFGTLVSPKLRAAQLSFETVLETLEEIANMRSSMLCAYDQVQKEMDSSKATDKKSPMELINEAPPIKVDGRIVACEGDTNPALGHPIEFICLDKDEPAICKYCGLRYVQGHHH